MANKTYYQILGVSPTDDADTIRKAYRALAKQYHPDLHPDDQAAKEKFQEISEAWSVLGDLEKRKAYDDELAGRRIRQATSAGHPKAPMRNVTTEDYRNIASKFDEYFNPAKQKSTGARAGKGPINSDDLFNQVFGVGKKK